MIVLYDLLAALGISLHIFLIMMETGATQAGTDKKRIAEIASIFVVVQIGLQVLGIGLTWFVKHFLNVRLIERFYKIIYLLLLVGIGYQLIHKIKSMECPDEKKNEALTLKRCASLSLHTSGEALLLGMTMYHYVSLKACIFIVSLSYLTAITGFSYGYWNGVKNEKIICSINGVLIFFLTFQAILL